MAREWLFACRGCCASEIPGQQLGDAADGVVGDLLQHLVEIGFRVHAVELGAADQAVDRSGPLPATVRSRKEIVFAFMYTCT